MSIINSQPRIGAAGQSTGFKIERSLRFNSADSAYLNRTPASASNRTTWTWSGWVKRSGLGTTQHIFAGGQTTSVRFESDDTINFYSFSSQYDARINTSQVFRDVGAWYHIVAVFNTGSATTTLTGSSTDRMRLYVNGTQVSNFSATVVPSQNLQGYINNNEPHTINARYNGSYVDTNGNWYMTEVQFIDGSALTAASFGETDTDTGVWKPKAYSGSYGTNGFYLKFADNSGTTSTTLGKDSSGNGNNWTPNNFSVTAGAGNDSLVDTPTPYGTDTGAGGEVRGNYCTLNPLYGAASTISNGNLDATYAAGTTSYGTFSFTTGKWYWELTAATAISSGYVGLMDSTYLKTGIDWGTQSRAYDTSGNKYNGSSSVAYGASWGSGDVIGFAVDMDAGTIVFYKNGSSQGTAFSDLSGKEWRAMVYSASGTYNMNFGQRPFAYTAPSGFKALCTQNLPTPTIGATSTTRADDYFNTVLYTGNGNTSSNAITGVGFQPDFVWIKARSQPYEHNLLDAVRGPTKLLFSSLTNAESTTVNFNSFDSDGFNVDAEGGGSAFNQNGTTYVAWNWKANGAGSTNNAGSIQSTVSANTTAGFSIVTYTGNGTSGATVGHGLGVTPSMVILKRRDAVSNWQVKHVSLNANQNLELNSTAAVDTAPGSGYISAISSTTLTLLNGGSAITNVNANTGTYLVYCFAPIAGYSAFGSYTGNGSSDGTFVYTGFRPKFVMVKNTSATSYWQINDTARNSYNLANLALHPNVSDAEATYSNAVMDILSNGFKLRGNDTYTNTNTNVYIYAAFAEVPQKFALGR